MTFSDLGKSFERLIRCTNSKLDANSLKHTSGATLAYDECIRSAYDIWERLEAQVKQATEKAAPARAWLSAHLERKLFLRLEMLLITIRERAEVAICSSASAMARSEFSRRRELQLADVTRKSTYGVAA